MILALDSVFEHCSVALVDLEGNTITEQTLAGKRLQTQQILPLIQTLLSQQQLTIAQLSAIAFNRGPGAFSGIRINTAVAQALAFAHDLPCLPVSSLQAVAQTAFEQQGLTHVYAAIDARMQQVYFGEFILASHTMQAVSSQTGRLLDYDSMTDLPLTIVGDGADLLASHAEQERDAEIIPTAAIIGRLGAVLLASGGAVTAEQALPVYLRHNAWKTLVEQGR